MGISHRHDCAVSRLLYMSVISRDGRLLYFGAYRTCTAVSRTSSSVYEHICFILCTAHGYCCCVSIPRVLDEHVSFRTQRTHVCCITISQLALGAGKQTYTINGVFFKAESDAAAVTISSKIMAMTRASSCYCSTPSWLGTCGTNRT